MDKNNDKNNKLEKKPCYPVEKLENDSGLLRRGLDDLGITTDDKTIPENIWKQFEGRANTSDILEEKAKGLAKCVIVCVSNDIETLFNNVGVNNQIQPDHNAPKIFRKLFLEFTLFYIHFTDRLAFGYLNIKERDVFVDGLCFELRNLLTESLSDTFENIDEKAHFFNDFSSVYAERQTEYAKYKKMIAEKNEGTGNTLFWEFEEKISDIFEKEMGVTEFKMIIILYIQSVIGQSISMMQIANLLET